MGAYLGRYLSVLCSLIELDALTQPYPLTFYGWDTLMSIPGLQLFRLEAVCIREFISLRLLL